MSKVVFTITIEIYFNLEATPSENVVYGYVIVCSSPPPSHYFSEREPEIESSFSILQPDPKCIFILLVYLLTTY
jgi:hypothetical protein